MEQVQQATDRLYKKYFGKMVASLLYFSREIDLQTAEDLVQDAFSSALIAWKNGETPSNPEGWLFRVCRNKALNKIKKGSRVKDFSDKQGFGTFELPFHESFFEDQQLRLLFVCAHAGLSPKVQVIITLKYVANLKVESIARVFGMTIDGVDKLLLRARQRIKMEELFKEEPGREILQSRVPVVHKIIYLIFTEGYKASWGKEILREELCEEALLLNKALLDSDFGNKETMALQALMLFNAARFKARFGASGELLDLEEHDRTLWNKDLIRLGGEFLKQSRGLSISSYHYEASIAWLHCTAESFDATNWQIISELYHKLLDLTPNPFIELNYAIALYYARQKQKAINILRELERNPYLNQYYLLNAALGKINFLEGNHHLSREYFLRTLSQTHFQVEKDYILRMIGKVDEAESR